MSILRVTPGTAELQQAFDRVLPGDTVELLPGTHSAPAIFDGRSGTPGNLIRLRAQPGAVIDGGRTGNPNVPPPLPNGNPRSPQWQDYAFLKLRAVEWLTIEDLDVANCWPSVIFATDCRNIAVRDCSVQGASYAIFVRDDASATQRSGQWLVEGCSWTQDSSPQHLMWSQWDWRELHGGEGGHGTLRHFNGAFFGTYDAGGGFVVRSNTIQDAFNALRFGASDHGNPTINNTVRIYDNDFLRIRDNPVEPEGRARDWVVRHNRIVDCHTWFSFDNVGGGFFYIYGNLGRFTSKQGGGNHDRGKVLKFSQGSEAVADWPIHIFNNSLYLRCPVSAGDPAPDQYHLAHIRFFNNAVAYCAQGDHPSGVCDPATKFVADLLIDHASCRIDVDLSDNREFPAVLRAEGYEMQGAAAPNGVFRGPLTGDLILKAGSSGFGMASRSIPVTLPDGTPALLTAHDVGAWQNGKLVTVPALEADPDFVGQLGGTMRPVA